jgi:tetratricopeptide (TPR) repeat protein
LSGQLPWDDVKYLCKTYKTDALVSLDLLETSVQTDIKKDVSFYEVTNIGYITEDVEKATMKIKYKAHISVYNSLAKILTGYVLTDTLYWEDSDRSIIKLFEKFTPVKEALMETGIAIALDFADEITPNWERDKRDLFVRGDKRFREALLFIKNNELEKAVNILNEVLQQAESEKVKSEAEFNLALLYELQGELDQAVEWAQKSYETMNRNNTYNYLEMLKERKINL